MPPYTAEHFGLKEVCVDFGTFPVILWCVAGPEEHAQSYVEQKWEEPIELNAKLWECRGFTFLSYPDFKEPVIWIPGPPKRPQEIATLAHEVLHAVKYILRHLGVPDGQESDEVYCYALGHGVETILTGLGIGTARRAIRR